MSEEEARKSQNEGNPSKLYVSNLDSTFSNRKLEADLESLFEKYGSIRSIAIRRNDKFQKVYAFVLFSSPQEASTALENLDGEYLGDIKLRVEFQRGTKETVRKEGRRQNTLTCYRCGAPGHFARFCKQQLDGRQKANDRPRQRSRDRRKKRYLSSSDSSSESHSHRRHRKNKETGREVRRSPSGSESGASSSQSE